MNSNHTSHFSLLVKVFTSLIFLTIITVLASKIHFSSTSLNILVTILIATVKASIVFYYFMHLKWEDFVTKLFAVIAFPFLLLLFSISLWDIILKINTGNIF